MDERHKTIDHVAWIVREQAYAHLKARSHDGDLIGYAFLSLAEALQSAALGNSPHPGDIDHGSQ